jgi:hypothetical protein
MTKNFLKSLITFSLCICSMAADAKLKRITLRKAMKDKLVSIMPVATGGYCNKGLSLDITSTCSDTLSINIESGLEFRPKDSTVYCQPLILQGDEVLVLNSEEKKNVLLQTYCGNSGARGPYKGLVYSYYKQQDTNLINVLRYGKANNLPPRLIQAAVWVFTNSHHIRSVYNHDNPIVSEEFVKYLAKVRKETVPTYYMEHSIADVPNRPVIRRGEEKVYVNVNWTVNEGYRNVYVSVYRPDGSKYKQVGNIISDKYGSTAAVELNLLRDKKGQYIVRLHDDANNILQEKIVVLGDM